MTLEITEVKIFPIEHSKQLKAFVRITLSDSFVIRDLKIIHNSDGNYFVAMPTRKDKKGVHHDIAHPISQEMRESLEKTILNQYFEEIKDD